MKSSNQALLAAVFLVIGGLLSGVWPSVQSGIVQNSGIFSGSALVRTAQAQNSSPAISAVDGDASISTASTQVDTDNANNPSFVVLPNGLIEDLEAPLAGSIFAMGSAHGGENGANESSALPDFNNEFISPVQGRSSTLLKDGISVNIAVSCGTPVIAAASGLVVPDQATSAQSGNSILLEHSFGNGIFTRYSSLGTVLVGVGDYVVQGQEIGTVGQASDGCRLRFAVMGAQNPFVKQ